MKFGFRTPSLRKRIAARTSWKRVARHSLGLKAPRGMGWITDPKRAAYNRIYNRTTVDVTKRSGARRPAIRHHHGRSRVPDLEMRSRFEWP